MTRRSSSAALVAATMLTLASDASGDRLTKGPWLQAVDQGGITVMWESADQGPGEVRIGEGNDLGRVVASPGNGPVHEVRIDGLDVSSGYHYQASSGGITSDPSRFVTAPSADEPITFLINGDNRSDHDQHAQVVAAMVSEAPDFVINTGDMVSDGNDESHWQTFFDIEHELLRSAPIYPAIGNHEESGGRARLFEKYFAPPTASSGREEFYAFTYGNSRFIVIDTHVKVLLGTPDFEQSAWLDRELVARDPDIQHKFVVMHHGPYSSKPGRSGNLGINLFWMDKFRDNGVDMVISGHDHYYERGVDGRGVRYAIVGGGGAPLYDTNGPGNRDGREIAVSQGILSYVVMTVTGGRVEGCAKDTLGNTIECFAWGEAGPVEPDLECRQAADCSHRDSGDCAGAFACDQGQCLWTCEENGEDDPDPDVQPDPDPDPNPWPECLAPADCAMRATPDWCGEGEWTCGPNQRCLWECEAADGECEDNAGCAGREAFDHCDGAWVCTDDVCEYSCSAGPGDDAPGDAPPVDDFPAEDSRPGEPTDGPGGDPSDDRAVAVPDGDDGSGNTVAGSGQTVEGSSSSCNQRGPGGGGADWWVGLARRR